MPVMIAFTATAGDIWAVLIGSFTTGALTLGLASRWLRRRLGKDSVIITSMSAAARDGAQRALLPAVSRRLDDGEARDTATDAAVHGLTVRVGALEAKVSDGFVAVRGEMAAFHADVLNRVDSFAGELSAHLVAEEGDRQADIRHRQESTASREERDTQIAAALASIADTVNRIADRADA